jgi:hypothetical protein
MKNGSLAFTMACLALLGAAFPGCSSSTQPAITPTGGHANLGGNTATGGSSVMGGTPNTGGTRTGGVATGGTTPTGGSATTGGSTAGGSASGGNSAGGGGVAGPRDGGVGGADTGLGDSPRATGGSPLATGGSQGTGGAVATGGSSGTGGAPSSGGSPAQDAGTPAACGTEAAVITYPDLPGAVKSPLYTITANGKSVFVEKLTKYSPEMQVHYAHVSLPGTCTAAFAVTVGQSFNAYSVSPKSRKLTATKSGNTVSFSSGPNYLVLQFDSKELLFLFIDGEEVSPPRPGDANVVNVADLGIDNTGASLVTAKIQSAINAASGAAKNIVYFPPGKYKVGELWMKSNMTLYLAGGAVLYGSNTTGDFNTGSGGINIEGCSHGVIRMYKISDAKILGRGVIDGNGLAIRAQADTKINLFKIEQSTNILIDGVVVRDSSFWNTLIYRSDLVTIQNLKMINARPTTTQYNNTDGVDFDESTNGKLYNAFLYTGDDAMATKNEEASGTVNTKTILHEKVVLYTNSAGCKIGTKTMGQSMDGIVFKDIDIVKAGRALVIDGADTAVVQNTKFQQVRIEAADSSLVDVQNNSLPSWRTAAGMTVIKETTFTDVSADVRKAIGLHGKSSSVNVTGVHFENFTVQGKAVSSTSDLSTNSYVSGITFK